MMWLQKHIAVVCMVFGLFSGMCVLISWGVGYYANALYGYHFEIASCWQGVSAIGVGLVGLLKWLVDSYKNSLEGRMPGEKE